jgi:alkanesulfonate monooxygenase SsuD/methylene tetrahydromethanopterin reductase-like flavin-dependent oxidoreductase (luciferase family)
MAAAATSRVTVGPFVVNVMNRHPAVLARMASTLQIASGGRLILGMGIGGAPKEHAAFGIEFPGAKERAARLEEAIGVIRALWSGGPVTRPSPWYPLEDAHAFPVPTPPPPIVIGGETPAGARLAGRIGDGWSTFDDNFEQNLPVYLEALAASGRRARTSDSTSGSRATGWVTPTSRRARGAARHASPGSAGAAGAGDRTRPDDPGRRRARRGRRTLVGGGIAPDDDAVRRADRPHSRLRPVRGAGATRRRAVREVQPAGLRDVKPRAHGTVFLGIGVGVVVRAGRAARRPGIGPFTPRSSRSSPTVMGSASLVVKNEGTSLGSTTCRISDPTSAAGLAAIVQSPRIQPGATLTFDATVTGLGDSPKQLIAECSSP